MENHAKESIKHKVELPNSKTINIEGTKFKYEIHYDQLDDKDLLRIEKYANHIFHAYQEKYGLDMNTDHTVKGFIYNSLTDLRNAHPGNDKNFGFASDHFHYYSHESGSIAHNLTTMIYFTLNFYNKKYQGYQGSTFIRDVEKELESIRLDDNQEKQNTAEKPETTINQGESKDVEPSGPEEEKIKLDEEKSSQEKISPETVLPDLNNSDNNKEESNTAEKPETTIYQEKQEESKKVEPSCSGGEEKSKVEEEKSYQEKEKISPETVLPDLNNSDNNQEEPNTAEKSKTTINQEESKDVEPSGPEEEGKSKVKEEKSSQEEISLKTVLPNSKTINIEGTNFKYEIHYDQLDDKDLLRIEKYANHIFHAYQERYGLDINTDYTFKSFIYNNLTDWDNASPWHNTVHAGAASYHYSHKSGPIAHDLTAMIYFTLNWYNIENYGISCLESHFIRDIEKELKAIRLDDNQGESNTEEKTETTINQEKELEEQDVIPITDHPPDDYNYDYHLIGWRVTLPKINQEKQEEELEESNQQHDVITIIDHLPDDYSHENLFIIF